MMFDWMDFAAFIWRSLRCVVVLAASTRNVNLDFVSPSFISVLILRSLEIGVVCGVRLSYVAEIQSDRTLCPSASASVSQSRVR